MEDTSPTPTPRRQSVLHNWLSLAGLTVAVGSLFSFLLLFVLDAATHLANPYIGILTYLVAPGFLILGLGLVAIGALWHRHRLKSRGPAPALQVDLSRPRDRRLMGGFILGAVAFLLLSAIGSYKTYQFTESAQFCGQVCHTVMEPERVTYLHGPHARVSCTDCHIGPGATWFVRSKLSGTYQVYATLFDKYSRPIPTPVKNLRPAQDTCEQCHWPKRFVGNLDKTFYHFLGVSNNAPFTVRLLLKVGGADPTHGPVGGIHWHMSVANKVEYLASDEGRQHIPWVRLTDALGTETVFREANFTNTAAGYAIRTMDCIDCHNRPAHRYSAPDAAVDLALELHQIDRGLAYIKTNAVFVLTRNYRSEAEAREGIATFLAGRYPNDPRIRQAIPVVQRIYADNFFPRMNARWSDYPDNIGHKNWPGCFRCHDGLHQTADGTRTIRADCNACHIILAQGSGAELLRLSPTGQPFDHPGGELDPSMQCSDCHTGGP
jgi:NapC/NirT cytochrome c family, N-terminal region